MMYIAAFGETLSETVAEAEDVDVVGNPHCGEGELASDVILLCKARRSPAILESGNQNT